MCARVARSFSLLVVLLSGCSYTTLRYKASAAPAEFVGEVWRCRSPSAGVDFAAFSPDGKTILIQGAYARRVLDTETGRALRVFDNERELRRPFEYIASAPSAALMSTTLMVGALGAPFAPASPPASQPTSQPTSRAAPLATQPRQPRYRRERHDGDGRIALIQSVTGDVWPAQTRDVQVVDVASGRVICEVEPARLGICGYLKSWSAETGRGLFDHFGIENGRALTNSMSLVDLAEGRELCRVPLRSNDRVCDLSPDGCFALLVDGGFDVWLYKLADKPARVFPGGLAPPE